MARIVCFIGLFFSSFLIWAGPKPDPVVALGVEVQPINVSCAGSHDGSFRVTLISNGAVILYQWSSIAPGSLSGIGTLSTSSPSDYLDSLPPGDYLFTIIDLNGADTTFGASIIEPPPLGGIISILSNYAGYAVACAAGTGNGRVRAEVSGGNQGYSYAWSSGASGPVALQLSPGQHEVSISDINGCYLTLMVTLDAPPPVEADIAAAGEPCLGQGTGMIEVLAAQGGIGPYTMSLGTRVENGYAAYWDSLASGMYHLHIKDSNGCLFDEDIDLPAGPAFEFSAGPDTAVFTGDTLRLSVISDRPLVSIKWFPATQILQDSLFENTLFFPFSSTGYSVLVRDEQGCLSMDSILIEVHRNRSLYFPNVFAPDGNIIDNQSFSIYGDTGVRGVKSLRIFDRFGRVWFDQHNLPVNAPDSGWKGDASGERAIPGVYFWQAIIVYTDEREEIFEGDVTLIR